jgi:hypothetical protein
MNEATKEIERGIEAFYKGEPQFLEIEIVDGVTFHFDNGHQDDLMEYQMPAAVLIDSDSPNNQGVPTQSVTLSKYSVFGDAIMADVISQAVYNAGGQFEELVFEYSSNNSDEEAGFLVFIGSIPNERVRFNWETCKMEVKEEYAL